MLWMAHIEGIGVKFGNRQLVTLGHGGFLTIWLFVLFFSI